MKRLVLMGVVAAALLTQSAPAHAFCGFYVGGAGKAMFNNATQVVLMRVGTRTVLSMQNNYQGPPDDFAMVVPVPVVLQEEHVKTLPAEVLAKVDAMGAPRLVEYWELDPCAPEHPPYDLFSAVAESAGAPSSPVDDGGHGVTIEAQFTVGEYDIVILSAKESTGLDTWLRQQKYQIPEGAEPLLRPYVESGSKFFVAKVDPEKVRFEGGMAMLSPLRFVYDSDELVLPIRLGLANSSGTQDLIVNILAPSRYEVANYRNVTIPTNLEVRDEVRQRFGEFYAALFDRTVEVNPGAVITEYAWDATSCDPCPGPTIDDNDLATLGADVLDRGGYGGYTLTRLHARYGKADMKEDLVFKEATAIVGGREQRDAAGALEARATPSDYNNFQGRYIIRHEWTGVIECKDPVRGRWGGPPDGDQIAAEAAVNLAFAPRGGVQLPMLVADDVPEIAVQAGVELPARPAGEVQGKAKGCGCATTGRGAAGTIAVAVLVALLTLRRRTMR